jgi:hypothetical protein
MDLAERDQWPRLDLCCGARSQKKEFSIAIDVFTQIVLGEPQVKRPATVNGALAAAPRAEGVDKPGNPGEHGSAKHRQFGSGLFGGSDDGRHSSILNGI